MASEGNGFTHYIVSNEVVLGEARVIEKYNEWISLAFIKLGNRKLTPSDPHPQAVKPTN